MTFFILIAAVVLTLCVYSDKLSGKIGVPALLIFMGVGMLFGVDGILKIPFENYEFSSLICEAALIVIMFTGGFSVKIESAKPVMVKACLMSTIGVVLTAAVTGVFCFFVLGFSWQESFLMGAVISSTDAASVFAVLRSKRLNLKNGLAPLLEVESGSNDPFSYMLTVIALSLMKGEGAGSLGLQIFTQLFFGLLFGVAVGAAGVFALKRFKAQSEGFGSILLLSAALFAYGLPTALGGNGYLSVYIAGAILGSAKISGKTEAVGFLNGITGLCQIAVFFLLGLLATPSEMLKSLVPALLVFLCLTLISRPVAVALLCYRTDLKEKLFIALAGLRGASSVVFSIMAVISSGHTENNVFNIVFCVCLLSMLVQGTLLPTAARKLQLIDDGSDVLRTFNDYRTDNSPALIRVFVNEGHQWENKQLSECHLPDGSLAVMIKRGEESIVPRGNTVLHNGDNVILTVPPFEEAVGLSLREINVSAGHPWAGGRISALDLPANLLIVLIKRGEESIIPDGATEIHADDIVVVTDREMSESPA